MKKSGDRLSVLIVSVAGKAADFLCSMFAPARFSSVTVSNSVGDAKRRLVDSSYDLIVINTPLPDEYGAQFAINAADTGAGVMLLVRSEQYEQAEFETEDYGVLTITKPGSPQIMQQAVNLLAATVKRVRMIEKRASDLQTRMNEIRAVNRAKLLLVERLSMTETEAHRYIEKNAMDRCVKKSEIAADIVRIYGGTR